MKPTDYQERSKKVLIVITMLLNAPLADGAVFRLLPPLN